MTKGALLVFTRAPVPGKTKTRLVPLLGEQGAAEFHQSVLHTTLEHAQSSYFETIDIWCDGDTNDPFLQQCSEDFSCAIKTQQGSDLGERMNYALYTTLATNDFVVVIGSDCPALSTEILNQSYQHLSNGKDVILGPAKDGGYYLIGLKKSNPEIFQGIIWSESDVAERTRQNLARLNLSHVELEELVDIDTPDDYRIYFSNA